MRGQRVPGHQGTCPKDTGGQTAFLKLSCPCPGPCDAQTFKAVTAAPESPIRRGVAMMRGRDNPSAMRCGFRPGSRRLADRGHARDN
jgi:hypothetical protein